MEDSAGVGASKQKIKISGSPLKIVAAVAIVLAVLLLADRSWGERRPHYPVPPAPAESQQPEITTRVQARPNPVDLERQGRELAALASTIPADIQQINKGILPKDVVGKLKRIEKLSKQLRGEISQ